MFIKENGCSLGLYMFFMNVDLFHARVVAIGIADGRFGLVHIIIGRRTDGFLARFIAFWSGWTIPGELSVAESLCRPSLKTNDSAELLPEQESNLLSINPWYIRAFSQAVYSSCAILDVSST